MSGPLVRVLVVDDSAVARQVVSGVLAAEPGVEVLGAVPDPYTAAARLAQVVPDVLVLDLHMPRMDGLTFLRQLMAQHPIPVVICSSYSAEGSRQALEALALGAVDVVAKPGLGPQAERARIRLREAVRAAAGARVWARTQRLAPRPSAPEGPSSDVVVAIGASTGGVQALRAIVPRLPPDAPGCLVVQHMPAGFTQALARHLDEGASVRVREAVDGEALRRGQVLIAPGDRHLVLAGRGGRWRVQVQEGDPVRRHRPSVDVLFGSVARVAGARAVGVLLTGMGDDGAEGLLAMRRAGGFTLAQDEATSVVYGMPREAARRGAAAEVVSLDDLAPRLLRAAAEASAPRRS